MKLLKYQSEIFWDESRFVIIEKARRVGITWTLAGKAVKKRLSQKQDLWFVSANLDTAKEFIRYCKDWAEVLNLIGGTELIDISTATTETVYFPNGSRIGVLSSNPTALRGLSGDVILDELAFHEQQDALMTAAQPVTTWAEGSLTLVSSHNGPATTFYRMCEEARKGDIPYKLYKIDLPKALEDGIALKIKGDHQKLLPDIKKVNEALTEYLRSTCVSDEAFKQEFLCEPVSLQALITAAEYDALALWTVPTELDPSIVYRPLHIGIDVGRSRDITCAWVIEEYENPKSTSAYDRYDYKTVAKLEISNETIPSQWERIRPLIMHPSVSTVAIDQGTVGRSLADLVKDAFPSTLMITFTLPMKAKLAERLKSHIAYKRISLPLDEVTRADLLSLKRQVSKNGNISYDGRTKEGHCDRFWSAALSLEAACSCVGAELA